MGTGSKYEATRNLDYHGLKAAILADLKAAATRKVCTDCPPDCGCALLKGAKFSLKKHHHSSYRVLVTLPRGATTIDRDLEFAGMVDYRATVVRSRESLYARTVNAVGRIVHAFGFDKSDISTDYFHVRFYLDVRIAGYGEAQSAIRAQAKAVEAAFPCHAENCGEWNHGSCGTCWKSLLTGDAGHREACIVRATAAQEEGRI